MFKSGLFAVICCALLLPSVAAPAVGAEADPPWIPASAGMTAVAAAAVAGEGDPLPDDVSFGTETTVVVPGEPELAAMLATAQQVLQAAHERYEGVTGEVSGFYPGALYVYPGQPIPFYFYSRDTATILPAARYFFDDASLRTSIEEHLALQYRPDTWSVDRDEGIQPGAGAISATISPALDVNKATVVSDEETSLIKAAFLYYRAAGGPVWLQREIEGETVIGRLNAAVEWLLTHRLDPEIGLIIRGDTTDWGDVKREPALNPTDIAPGDEWTYSIYDQAIGFSALMELAVMNMAVGEPALFDRYYVQAQQLRQRTTELLWMPERGYFRIRGYVSPDYELGFDEDEIVAIGNAAALYYGLATAEQAPQIVSALETARVESGAYKPGLTLHPPYPTGTFPHGLMVAHGYQNGAIWDWWGGRQIMGEFANGHAELATHHLELVARDWANHPGEVYEWESPWLDRRADDYRYAGGAAVMAEALIEGLFGVSIARDELRLQPRLGARDGYIRAYQEAGNVYAAYRYSYEPDSGRIELRFGTNSPTMVRIRVLVPGQTVDGGPGTVGGEAGTEWAATLDGVEVEARIARVGMDTYVELESLPGERVLVLTPG